MIMTLDKTGFQLVIFNKAVELQTLSQTVVCDRQTRLLPHMRLPGLIFAIAPAS